MTLSREKLTAFLDGELPADEAAEIEALLRERPQLRAYVEKQRGLQSQMRAALSTVVGEAVPDRLIAAARQSPVSWQWRLANFATGMSNMFASRDFLVRSGLPATAALAVGLVVGIAMNHGGTGAGPFVTGDDGRLSAQGGLAVALNEQLASEQGKTSAVRIGVSYRARDGHYCRSFQLGSTAGLACRDPHAWTVATLASVPPEPEGAYQTAGAAMPEAVRAAIRDSMAGEPLDAAAERQARDQGWSAR